MLNINAKPVYRTTSKNAVGTVKLPAKPATPTYESIELETLTEMEAIQFTIRKLAKHAA